MKYSFVSLCTGMVLGFAGQTALAINEPVLCDFNGELEPEFLEEAGDTYGIMAGGMMIGNLLDVEISGGVTAEPTGGAISFDGSGDASGSLMLTLDGEDEEPAIDPEGLGSINLTLEEIGFSAQDAFKLTFDTVTSAGSYVIEVITEEGEASSYSGSLSTGSSMVELIPYGAFSISQGGGATFSQVGAIIITLSGGLAAEIGQLETTASLSGITKVDALLIDVDTNATVDPGDTLRYTITIPAASSASGVIVTDLLNTNTTLVVGSVTNTSSGTPFGTVTEGNTLGDTDVIVDLGTLPSADVIITFDALVNDPYSGSTNLCNQATVTATGLSAVLTDDPDDSNGSEDPTCTLVTLDTTPPVLTLPADTTVDQGTDNSPTTTGTATATDDTTASPVIDYSDTQTPGPIPFDAFITRTWTATDEAGNVSQSAQIISLADTLDRSLQVSQQTYGLFNPISDSGNRQLGTIDTEGNVSMLGTDASLDSGDISTGAGLTTYDRANKIIYALGKTSSDGQSRIFSVQASDGSSTNAVLSFGSDNTVVGIWWDEVSETLYGVFQVGAGLSDRQLASIDPETGTVSLIGTANTSIAGTIGGILTGSRTEGEAYFLGSTGGLPGAVYTVNLTNGVMTAAPLTGANYNAIAGMNSNPINGKIYALLFQGTERRLAQLDPNNGTVVLLGTHTVAGGGITIGTYTGVNTLDQDSGTFLFVGRYHNGTNHVWAIFGVDLASGETTYSDIDHSAISANGYYGLDYAEVKELDIVDSGFIGADFYIDVSQGTSFLKPTSSADLVSLPFTDIAGVTETNDGNGKPNRFLIPSSGLSPSNDFFRVETE